MDDRELRQWIEKHLGVKPQDISKYKIALTLRQYEALEFFGDSVLGFVVAEYLITKYKFIDEPGWFTHVKAGIVENNSLVEIAREIGLKSVAIAPSTTNKEQITDRVLGDMLEALIGAIYLDYGIKKSKEVVQNVFDLENRVAREINSRQIDKTTNPQRARRYLEKQIKNDLLASLNGKNPISALQEFLAKKGESPPEYNEIEREGEPHQPIFKFEAVCRFRGRSIVGEGKGRKIKAAKIDAARNLLEKVIQSYQKAWNQL